MHTRAHKNTGMHAQQGKWVKATLGPNQEQLGFWKFQILV
jgi:hypothetical protein